MNWQIYTAISVAGLSVSMILQRVLLKNKKTDPVAYSVLFQLMVGLVLLIAAIWAGFSLEGLKSVWQIALVCLFLYGIGTVVYAKTLQKVEASVFSVFYATHAFWMMLVGLFFLNESLTIIQVLGSVLIFLSATLLIKNIKSLKLGQGTIYGLVTGLIYGFAISCWAYVGRNVESIVTWASISFIGAALFSFLVSPNSLHKIKPLVTGKVLNRMVVLALVYATGSLSMLLAYKYGNLSIVSPLRQTGIIVTVLLAFVFLKPERNRVKIKIVAALLCFIGSLLILV